MGLGVSHVDVPSRQHGLHKVIRIRADNIVKVNGLHTRLQAMTFFSVLLLLREIAHPLPLSPPLLLPVDKVPKAGELSR